MSHTQFYRVKPVNDLAEAIGRLPEEPSQGVQWIAQYYALNGKKLACDGVDREVALVSVEQVFLDNHKGFNIELTAPGWGYVTDLLEQLNVKPADIPTLLGFATQHADVLRGIPPREHKEWWPGGSTASRPDIWAGGSMIPIPWNIRPDYTKEHLGIYGRWNTLCLSTGEKPTIYGHEIIHDISLWNRFFLVEQL